MPNPPLHNVHLNWAHPLVQAWFKQQFGEPTEPQTQGWPAILSGQTTLISAPTGSGKTLAAFLVCINELICKAVANELLDQTEVVYISPLKALSNDIQKNLLKPLEEISVLAKQQGIQLPEIRVAVRTGDTLAKERLSMLKKPPHILVTTPESFYILLTAEKSRAMLATTRTVIVDEIHAIVNDKRGSHLALSLERLAALCKHDLLRIGLSATQKPLTSVANFLAGNRKTQTSIINIGHQRQLELAVMVPKTELGAVASNELWDEIYDKIATLSTSNRSILVFVNTRRLAERVAHHIAERIGEDKVCAHHGSLSRKIRLDAENKLKNGELKVLVATASLELGIDIGSIDLVCQISSPRSIAVGLQRVGRAGHWHGAISKGYFFATTRDDLLECAALIYAMQSGDLDQLIMPEQPIDILAQQIIAMCAVEDWEEQRLFHLIKKAYPYRHLSKKTFTEVLTMLSEGMTGSRGRYGTFLFRDQVNHLVKARRGSRLVAITNGGAIPDNGLFVMIAEPQGLMVGTLDEDFAVESNRGDVILLGTTSWQIKRIESVAGRVIVEDAHGAPPSVPFWRGEAPSRTQELSEHVSNLREKISDLLPSDASEHAASVWLQQHCGVDHVGALQLIHYIQQGRALLKAVPTQKRVIAERFFDEAGGMQLIIHAPFGARINKAWGLALRKKFCRSFNFELQAAATDDGLNIALAEQHSFPLSDVFHFLNPKTIEKTLTQAVLQSPIFTTRWRWCATRALALVRFRRGKKVPPNIQRMLADDLLAAVFPDARACQDNLAGRDIELPDQPLINETMKDVLTEAMDLSGLKAVLQSILEGKIEYLAVDTPMPSLFSHEILNANPYAYLDDAPLEERRARAVEMRRLLPDTLQHDLAKLDPDMIKEVEQQAWPDIRNADELHDVLQTFIALPQDVHLSAHQTMPAAWHIFMDELIQTKRAGVAKYADKLFWFAVEKAKTFAVIYPDAVLQNTVMDIDQTQPVLDEAMLSLLLGWMQHLGPISADILSDFLALNASDVNIALLKMESNGSILRGNFRGEAYEKNEWAERRLLARIHRLTISKLRQEIEPVTVTEFVTWLAVWQHLTPESQLKGKQGVLEIIKQLQGFEMPANAWEEVLAKRVSDYSKDLLDDLCLSGQVGWGRLSLHPTLLAENEDNKKGYLKPSRVAAITFFIRGSTDWMPLQHAHVTAENLEKLSPNAKHIYEFLKERGASFIDDIIRELSLLKTVVQEGLWELVAAGVITADSFDNLRAFIDRRRRLHKKGRRRIIVSFAHSGSRWAILFKPQEIEPNQHLEAVCWMLLNRYGVIFRDLLTREKNMPRWRELLPILRRLEDRGEIRGGRFINGFVGEQFALPYAVTSLRAMRRKNSKEKRVVISSADPLNLIGILLPGSKIPILSGKQIVLIE